MKQNEMKVKGDDRREMSNERDPKGNNGKCEEIRRSVLKGNAGN